MRLPLKRGLLRANVVGAGRLCMWRVRGARPGKPGRQTAGASSRTPQEAPVRPRRAVTSQQESAAARSCEAMATSRRALVPGTAMLCPYEETALRWRRWEEFVVAPMTIRRRWRRRWLELLRPWDAGTLKAGLDDGFGRGGMPRPYRVQPSA